MTNDTPLLREILSLCDLVGMAPSTFGKQAVGDPALVGKMQRGRLPGLHLEARIRTAMARIEKEFVARSQERLAAIEARHANPESNRVQELSR